MKIVAAKGGQAGWDSFVLASEGAGAYHRFGWKTVFVKSFGHPCHYLAAVDDNGVWHGILPLVHMRSRIFGNFLVSLPFVNYGGLICENEAAAALLLDEAEKIRHSCGATHVELRHVARRLEILATKQHKVTMILDLTGSADTLWKAFDPKLRNQIRKAQKSGLEFRRGHLELIDGFYEVFARNMRDLGTPVYSKQFFRNVLEAFPDTTAIIAVLHEGKIIAAGIASWFKGRIEVPWASSIKDYKALCPNHMLYWEAIRFAIERGFREFDFGRSTPNEGTYNFKKQWGALPVPLNWQYLMDAHGHMPELNPGNPKYRAAIRVWQRLPVSVTKMLGPRIVRNIP
ncbi:MAG: FemAB family XrtA/PEP-CTERM system-associated protein [Sulfuricaulis sp.]